MVASSGYSSGYIVASGYSRNDDLMMIYSDGFMVGNSILFMVIDRVVVGNHGKSWRIMVSHGLMGNHNE